MRPSKKNELVEKALAVFYRHGFHATGMDTLVAETGISKTSMYKHFRTKDDLIVATLRLRDAKFRAWFQGRVEALADDPRGRLFAVFDALSEWLDGDDFQGCMFIKASSEFQEADHPIHVHAAEHKRALVTYLETLTRDAGAPDPGGMARRLLIIKEGATVAAHMSATDDPGADAKAAARVLLESALDAPPPPGRTQNVGALVFACPEQNWAGRGAAYVQTLRLAAPERSVHVVTGSMTDVRAHVADGSADVAIVDRCDETGGPVLRRLADDVIRPYATPGARAANDSTPILAVDYGPDFTMWAKTSSAGAPQPPLTFTSPMAALDHLIERGGTAYLPEDLADPYVESGVLVPVSSAPAFRRPLWLVATAEAAKSTPDIASILASA